MKPHRKAPYLWLLLGLVVTSSALIIWVRSLPQPFPDWWIGPAGVIILFTLLLAFGPPVVRLGARHGMAARLARGHTNGNHFCQIDGAKEPDKTGLCVKRGYCRCPCGFGIYSINLHQWETYR